MASNSGDNVFEEVMLQVGDSGKFQKFYNIIFNLIFVCVSTMATFNVIIILAVPDHWCRVPGREFTNFSEEEWKKLTIPSQTNSTALSQCSMYNETNFEAENNQTTECLYGWEYNHTYYGDTMATHENWVCNQKMYGTNFLVFGKIGEIVGTILAQAGDIYGRRPIFYASIFVLVIGRLGLIFSSGIYALFIVFSIVGSLPSLTLYQAPLVISVEISSVEDRTFIPLLQCIGWTTGLCIAPMIYWAIQKWIVFILVTTLPVLLFLFITKYMIESPRWLASKGKVKKCVTELKKIAKINGTQLTDKLITSLSENPIIPEKNFGAMSLFSGRNLAIKTLLIITSWICYMLLYLTLFLNVQNLEGNPFLNYFWQGIAELPGYFLGKYLCDTIGRKFTKLVGFIAMAVVAFILSYVLSCSGYVIIISICGIVLKFLSSIEFYAINLQTLEIYPTCLRQTGSSVGFLVASVFGIFTPYIIYLGTEFHPSYPYVIVGFLALIGGITGIFLPETLNEKLPETINEAAHFGVDQKLWSLPKGKTFQTVPNKVV